MVRDLLRRATINDFLFKSVRAAIAFVVVSSLLLAGTAYAGGPSFNCSKVKTGSIEEMICRDNGLAALDRKLAEVYSVASKKAVNEYPPVLKAEQRGWVIGDVTTAGKAMTNTNV